MALGSTTRTIRFQGLFEALLLYMLSTGSGESNWDVRLAGSQISTEGRVELFLDGKWGTIIDLNTWGYNEAQAACKQLGFHGNNVAVLGGGYYGAGSGTVHLANVVCPEEASALEQCAYIQVTDQPITHELDVAITCEAAIRLYGSKSSDKYLNGVIQLFSSTWITLCTTEWTNANSEVACRRLGFSIGHADKVQIPDTSTSFYQREYECLGDETTLEKCPNKANYLSDCPWHIRFLNCSLEETSAASPNDKSTFTLSTISGSLVFLVIIIVILLGYLVSIRKRTTRHRQWITSASGRQHSERGERERRRRRRTRRVRRSRERHRAPSVNTISNGQQGNDEDLPPYSRLEEDIPPPYSQLSLPPIEIPVVGREERYEQRPPRFTEIDAIEFFQELDAEQLRLQCENQTLVEQSQSRCVRQPPPDYNTVVESQQEMLHPVHHQAEIDNTSLTGSLNSNDEGDDISLSSCRNPISVIPKDNVNTNATVTAIEV